MSREDKTPLDIIGEEADGDMKGLRDFHDCMSKLTSKGRSPHSAARVCEGLVRPGGMR